jgi:CTP:molybdopterin cytidylyltransferase MocA
VVVASLAAPADPEFAALLGAPGVAAVQAALWDRARRWAHDVAPEHAYEATSLDAAAAAVHDHTGPVLLAAPDVPALSARHAAAGIDDLAAGCLLSLARATDGRPFLIAVPRMDDELLELAGALFDRVIRVASVAGRDIGMISVERRLATVGDARALMADPLAPPELVALLRPRLGP